MSKAALDHWNKDAAAKYAPKGVRVNAVAPGPIHTEIATRYGMPKEAYDQALAIGLFCRVFDF